VASTRNRLTDLRCAWKKATADERRAFIAQLVADGDTQQLMLDLMAEHDDAESRARPYRGERIARGVYLGGEGVARG